MIIRRKVMPSIVSERGIVLFLSRRIREMDGLKLRLEGGWGVYLLLMFKLFRMDIGMVVGLCGTRTSRLSGGAL